jgi:hypothetical protein
VNIAAIVFGVAVTAAVVIWFVANRRHPENAAGHRRVDREAYRFSRREADQHPGAPGAEAEGVAGPGQPVPGPSSEPP